ncbi:helix-turn-helix transcriptional regulator [Streptomyces sp. NPDC047014]|uniref:helix-turn-helix domain-containing protein n=1 Tax=Streptomyces sp. NPDC047014 TaxID=3155736 RepID=UPI0033E2F944
MPSPAPRRHFRKCAHCGTTYSVPVGPGRPRSHCSEKCRYASRTSGPPDCSEQDQDLQAATHDLQLEVTRLVSQQLAEPRTPDILRQLLTIENLVEDTKAAAVARGRARGDSWRDMAEGSGVSPDHLRKQWTPDRVARRLARVRKARAARPAVPASTSLPASTNAALSASLSMSVSVPVQPSPATTADGADGSTGVRVPLQPPEDPRQQLASALSFLQRQTKRSLKETALDMGISPSHLSRVVAGSRGPSWPVVLQFAAVVDADPTVLRVLWEAAQRPPSHAPAPPPADREAAARQLRLSLKSLHLATGSPDLWTIQRACGAGSGQGLRVGEIARILNGGQVPDWETTARIIVALRGRPAELRALWQATQPHPPYPPQQRATPPAGPEPEPTP